jgi:hypothetical protein
MPFQRVIPEVLFLRFTKRCMIQSAFKQALSLSDYLNQMPWEKFVEALMGGCMPKSSQDLYKRFLHPAYGFCFVYL